MKKKGSAFITVIGIIGVLSVLALSFISSSKEKVGISKLMSDEKKAEALAESATDFIIKYIKKNANDHKASDESSNVVNIEPVYYMLRAPLQAKGERDKDNFLLNPQKVKTLDLGSIINYQQVIDPSIKEIGWEGKVEVTSKCEICSAESFTPFNLNYQVPTIDKEHLKAEGHSAKFLDDDNNSCAEVSSNDWSNNDWELRFKFPSGEPTYEEYSTEVGILNITLKVSRDSESSMVLHLKATIWKEVLGKKVTVSKNLGDYDVQEEMDNTSFFPNVNPKTLQGVANGYTNGDPEYSFSDYVSGIRERKEYLNQKYKNYINDFDINNTNFTNPYFIEKGAVLRIKTTVKYKKSENNVLEKNLIAEIPFKVSDVQPIGPEYSFFVSNSTNVSNQSDIVSISGEPIHQLGKAIDINKNSFAKYNAPPPAGAFIVHNLPITGDKIDYTKINDGKHVPGMIRINSNYNSSNKEVTKVKSFLGILEKPEYNELKKFCTPFNENFSVNKFNTRVSFCWDTTTKQRYHEVELPLLFESEKHSYNPGLRGLENMLKIFKQNGFEILSVPTLFFGNCHMEYPLGLVPEGPINTEYSRARLTVKPRLTWTFTDETEIYVDYEPVSTYSKSDPAQQPSSDSIVYPFDNSGKEMGNGYEPSTFGMQKYKGYDKNNIWNSNSDFKYSPANCYDALQYAKKATKYYEDQSEFKKDLNLSVNKGGLKGENGYTVLNGVYYIKNGELVIDKPIKYKGNGLIVCKKKRIVINKDITRDTNDNTSTLGIIARTNNIKFNTSKVMAACFSNNAPSCTVSKFELYGNLVCNNFVRQNFLNAYIYYDNTICNVTPFASLRKVGKFEPKRYSITFADNWSKFAYEKNK